MAPSRPTSAPYPGIAVGPGGVWGNDIYVTNRDTGDLLRFNAAGEGTVIGSNFAGFSMIFGPDEALYVVEYDNDRVLRIAPNNETLGLKPNEHQVSHNRCRRSWWCSETNVRG